MHVPLQSLDFQDSHFTEQWLHTAQYVDMPKYGVCVCI